jgi:enoyl-CoA hydratase
VGNPIINVTFGPVTTIELNRPEVINSLNLEMIRLIKAALVQAEKMPVCRSVLFTGAGKRGFCAGGDIKALWSQVKEGHFKEAGSFFKEEYELDLKIHEYPKTVIVIADGVTMGGGLGLAAGADIIIATEKTLMAMPETRIGFFPDVGATGWLFEKCRKGYPGFLGLTGYEMRGAETLRIGLATHLISSGALEEIFSILKNAGPFLPEKKNETEAEVTELLENHLIREIQADPEMDAWVALHFDRTDNIASLISSLNVCSWGKDYCEKFLKTLHERSPTALKLTAMQLALNRGKPLAEVFANDLKAANFIIRQADYIEGIRARVIEKDNAPVWNPASLGLVGDIRL